MEREIIEHAIAGLEACEGLNIYVGDLHNKLFNEDYFIIGSYLAEEFLKTCESGAFGAIGKIQEYENDNFGEVYTGLDSPERVANMYAYIRGEELLYDLSSYPTNNFDDYLTSKQTNEMINELLEML